MRLISKLLIFIIVSSLTQIAWAGPHNKIDPQPAPQELRAVEDALAGPHLVGLYYLDMNYIMRLEKEFVNEDDAKALPTPLDDENLIEGTALGLLRRSGLKATETVDYVVGAFTGNPREPGALQVAIGHFPANSITEKWKSHPSVRPTQVNGRSAWQWTPIDRDTCKPSDPQILVIDEKYLVIGDPGAVEWFLKRLNKAQPEKDLSAWRAYRSGKPFAFAVLLPNELQKVSKNMMAQMFAQNAEQQMPAVTGIYGGGTITWEPEGVDLELLLESNDAAWNREILKKFQEWKQQTERKIQPEFKSVKNLLNYLTLETTDRNLVLQFKINDALIKDFENIFKEGIDLFTASLSPSLSGKQSPPQEQTLPLSEVNAYTEVIKPGDLDPFDTQASPSESYDAQSGPFGIFVKGISLNAEHKDIMNLDVAVMSSPFPGMEFKPFSKAGEGAGAWFRVTHVYDRRGRELLLDEPCGKDRNSTYASLQKGFRNVEVKRLRKTPTIQKLLNEKSRWSHTTLDVLQGTKTAHLKRGILLSDIDRVEGEILLQLPSDILKRRIQAPFKGKEVQMEGLRIKMNEGKEGTVTYIASGEVERILETRALNGAGNYLRSSSKMASPILFGQGVNHSNDFFGTPRSVEFVLAREDIQKTYPFSFKFQRPAQPLRQALEHISVGTESKRGFLQQRKTPSPARVCSRDDLYQSSGGFHFCLNPHMSFWNDWQTSKKSVTADIKIHGPDHRAITHNLSAVQIVVSQAILRDGEKPERITLPVRTEQFLLMDSRYAPPLKSAQARLQAGPVDSAHESLTPVGLEGILKVRLPRQLETIRLDLNDLGNTAQAANGLKVRFTGMVENSVQLEIKGPRETLVQLQPQDAARKVLGQGRVTLKPSDSSKPNEWQAEITVSPETRYLAVVYAPRQDLLEIPFRLEK